MNKKNKNNNWIFFNKYLILSSMCSFLALYFPVVLRYNVNSLFNGGTRGDFDFLFFKLNKYVLRKEFAGSIKFNWIKAFSGLMLICFILTKLFGTLFYYYKEKSKLQLIDDKDKGNLSASMVDEFLSYFACSADLFVELFSAIKLNFYRRSIGNDIWKKVVLCTAIVLSVIRIIDLICLKYQYKNRNKERGIGYHLAQHTIETRFLNLSILFFCVFFLGICHDYEISDKNLINIILVAGNIQVLIGKFKKFMEIIPNWRGFYSKLFKNN